MPSVQIALGGTPQATLNASGFSTVGPITANTGGNTATLREWVGGAAGYSALYLNVSPATTNYTIISGGGATVFNSPGGAPILYRISNSGAMNLNASGLRISTDEAVPVERLEVDGNCLLGNTTSAHQFIGSQRWTTRSTSSSFTVDTTTTDTIILIDCSGGAKTVTLPAPTNGRVLKIKDKTGSAGTNNITIARNASEQIEGVAASYVMATNWGCITLVSDGTNWFIV